MIELRPYQLAGLNALWNYFSEKKGNPLLCWPTGVGKSLCPAIFIREVMRLYPNQRFLMVTHVSTLIKQNYDVLLEIWPNAPVGIYSAGLAQKEIAYPIIYGGIQSMIKRAQDFGHRDIIFIDEAHLISDDDSSMYQKFLAVMKGINPHVKVIGMSATPFRMGMGYITDNGIFTDIAHDLCSMKSFNQLVTDGYLAPLIPLRTKTELDVSDVQIIKGEYNSKQLQKAVDKNEITHRGLEEVVRHGADRRSWLLFASGIEHANHIAETLETMGIDCASVHSKQPAQYNDDSIKAFKNFELRAIVNYGKLTTGFNHPAIDLIASFRPTLSVPLHVQMLGRGTRPCEGKKDCLVLDFGRNVPRLGCINDPRIPRKKGEGGGDAPVKLCNSCGAYNYASARFCCNCGEEFIFQVKIVDKAGTEELIKKSEEAKYEWFIVDYVIYGKKQKMDRGNPSKRIPIGKPYILTTYFCGNKSFKQMVFPEHASMKYLFKAWWQQRIDADVPTDTDSALKHVSELRAPNRIKVWTNKLPYQEVMEVEF